MTLSSLWGAEFSVEDSRPKTKKIINKIQKPKELIVTNEKILKSKSFSIEDKLKAIEDEVHRVLSRYNRSTRVIYTIEDFSRYIDRAIENGIISIDTETNNTLDSLNCKIMGLCLYTPGEDSAYIPINHIDRVTNTRLSSQLTESDIKQQLDRLFSTKIIMHNSKFDCKVIWSTCGCKLKVYWDTQPGARILNENESAALKNQYISKIDSTQEKYDIEHLFKNIEYAILPPELFALYAATDSYITYKLYEYQYKEFNKPENSRIFKLFKDVEMPVIEVFTSMEINGISLDVDYAKRLSNKYHNKLDEVSNKLIEELNRLDPVIKSWKNSEKAHERSIDSKGKISKKEKIEQLEDPIALTSPTQLSILLYDILGAKVVDKSSPRGTGEDILEVLKKDFPICSLLLEQRSILKMLDAFIDTLPNQLSPRDGKIHSNFNPLGADTGRVSCTQP